MNSKSQKRLSDLSKTVSEQVLPENALSFFDKYEQPSLNYVNRICRENGIDPNDIVQEAMLKQIKGAFLKWRDLKKRKTFRSYLATSLHRIALAHIKSGKRLTQFFDDNLANARFDSDLSDHVFQVAKNRVDDAIRMLPTPQDLQFLIKLIQDFPDANYDLLSQQSFAYFGVIKKPANLRKMKERYSKSIRDAITPILSEYSSELSGEELNELMKKINLIKYFVDM